MTHTIKIDENLIAQAQKQTGNKTEKAAVEKAVREYLRMERIRKDVESMKGKVSFQ